jgi:hypothetical protein
MSETFWVAIIGFVAIIAAGVLGATIHHFVHGRQKLTEALLPRKIDALSNLYAALVSYHSALSSQDFSSARLAKEIEAHQENQHEGLHDPLFADFDKLVSSKDEYERARALATIYVDNLPTQAVLAQAEAELKVAHVFYAYQITALLTPNVQLEKETPPNWKEVEKRYNAATRELQARLNPESIKRLID